MVGGAISGYWAIGSVESAITPTSVMTMLMTPAKIGRSIKKCGKFTALTPRLGSPSFWFCGCRGARLRFRSGRCFLRHRYNFHSRLQQLETRGNNFLSVFEPVLYDPFAFESACRLEGAAFDRIIRLHHERVFYPLLGADDSVGNERRSIGGCSCHAHTSEETRGNERRVPVF